MVVSGMITLGKDVKKEFTMDVYEKKVRYTISLVMGTFHIYQYIRIYARKQYLQSQNAVKYILPNILTTPYLPEILQPRKNVDEIEADLTKA
uniref:Uncharacterized protein n=1 Tax=Eubacterium cellulosolvens (strain ATCC 43171 / JCM 9499 / 6) TaxID=633697 RepID=I5AVK7_EUBC6